MFKVDEPNDRDIKTCELGEFSYDFSKRDNSQTTSRRGLIDSLKVDNVQEQDAFEIPTLGFEEMISVGLARVKKDPGELKDLGLNSD